MNPGSDYTVGDLLTITGTSTFTPFVSAQVRVDNILNNVGDTIRVENITSFERKEYNKLAKLQEFLQIRNFKLHQLVEQLQIHHLLRLVLL